MGRHLQPPALRYKVPPGEVSAAGAGHAARTLSLPDIMPT